MVRSQPDRPSPRAWLAWAAGSIFFFHVFVLRVSPSVMVDDLMRDFAVGAAALGNLSAFYFYAYAALQIPVGVLTDRFGPRRLLTGSAAVCAAGCALFALSPGIEAAYAGRFMIGAGAAFGWVGTLSIIGWYFPQNRFASLAAITQLLGMLGGVVGQAPLALLVTSAGWRVALAGLAVAVALVAVLFWLVAPTRTRPPAHHEARLLDGVRAAVRNRQTWLNALTGFTYAGPMLGFAGLWAVPFLTTTYGLERTDAALLASFVFVGWGVGGLILGHLSDRAGRRKPFVLFGGALQAVALCAAIYLPDLHPVALGALFTLTGAGGSTVILTFARVREQNEAQAQGAAMGVVNTAIIGSAVVLQPLLGALLDQQWDGQLAGGVRLYTGEAYRSACAIMPIGILAGLLSAWVAREGTAAATSR